MQQHFLLSNGITSTLRRHPRAKVLRITVRADGHVSLTLPRFVSVRQGQAFLESKAAWILEKTQRSQATPVHFLRAGSREEYKQLKEAARSCILERLAFFQTRYPFQYQRVSVRHTQTRWGSCSVRGNLNFSYRLLLLAPRLRDYVIVHELCHLKELNHSQAFWDLVAQTFLDFKALRQELQDFAGVPQGKHQ